MEASEIDGMEEQSTGKSDRAEVAIMVLVMLGVFLAPVALYFDFSRSRIAGVAGIAGLGICMAFFLVQRAAFGNYYATTGYEDDAPKPLHSAHRTVSIVLAVAWALVSVLFVWTAYAASSLSAICAAMAAGGVAAGLIVSLFNTRGET